MLHLKFATQNQDRSKDYFDFNYDLIKKKINKFNPVSIP